MRACEGVGALLTPVLEEQKMDRANLSSLQLELGLFMLFRIGRSCRSLNVAWVIHTLLHHERHIFWLASNLQKAITKGACSWEAKTKCLHRIAFVGECWWDGF